MKALVDPNAPDVDPSVAPIEEEAVPGVHRVQFRVDKLDTDSGQAVCGLGVALGSRIPQVEALGGTPGDLTSNTHTPPPGLFTIHNPAAPSKAGYGSTNRIATMAWAISAAMAAEWAGGWRGITKGRSTR